jgi:hypothetical protein
VIARIPRRHFLAGITLGQALAFAARATVGAAEWQVLTPGGNRILHSDPLKGRFGTCLVGGDGKDGRSLADAEPLVAHILWWQYYRTYVAGQTMSGYFLFDEISRRVDWYDSVEALRTHAHQRSGAEPIAKKMSSENP